MEDNNMKQSNENEDAISISDVDVQMLDLDEGLNEIMSSNFIRGIGVFVSLLLAVGFGVMFIIGTVGLVKGKNSGEVSVEAIAVEANEEGTSETSGNDVEEE